MGDTAREAVPTPTAGHWCFIRQREHYEPCGCTCRDCEPYSYEQRRRKVLDELTQEAEDLAIEY